MAAPFLGSRAVLGPGIYAPQVQKSALQKLVSVNSFSHRFHKWFAGYGGNTVDKWVQNASDATNIMGGTDPYFRLSASASATCLALPEGILVTTGTTDGNDAIIAPHTVDPDDLFGGVADVSGLSLEAGYDIWLSWVIKFQSDVVFGEQILCAGTMTDPASSVTATADQDFCLFRVGTIAGTTNTTYPARIYVDFCKEDSPGVTTYDTGVDAVAGQTYIFTLRYRAVDSKIEFYLNGQFVGVSSAAYRTADDAGVSIHFTPVAWLEVSTAATTDAAEAVFCGVHIDIDLET